MVRDSGIDSELGALRAEVRAARESRQQEEREAAAPKAEPAAPPPEPEPQADVAAATEEFQQALQELADSAEGDIRTHPFLSVAVAFGLGLLVGRLMGR